MPPTDVNQALKHLGSQGKFERRSEVFVKIQFFFFIFFFFGGGGGGGLGSGRVGGMGGLGRVKFFENSKKKIGGGGGVGLGRVRLRGG